MADPLISVVIPLYNGAQSITRTLSSVIAQTYQELEIIVVDDGSTDDGVDRVLAFPDTRVRLISQSNGGAAAARNRGFAAARGDWIAFLDADDEWLPTKLARQAELLRSHPQVVWAAGVYEVIHKGRLRAVRGLPDDVLTNEGCVDAFCLLARGSYIWTGTVVVRRDVLRELGGMDTSLRSCDDRDLWLRLAAYCQTLAYVDEPIAIYHSGTPTSVTGRTIALGDLSGCHLARKHLADSCALSAAAQRAVRMHLRHSLLGLANNAIWDGCPEMARRVLVEFCELGLGPVPRHLRWRLRLPPWVWKPVWQAREAIWRMLL